MKGTRDVNGYKHFGNLKSIKLDNDVIIESPNARLRITVEGLMIAIGTLKSLLTVPDIYYYQLYTAKTIL